MTGIPSSIIVPGAVAGAGAGASSGTGGVTEESDKLRAARNLLSEVGAGRTVVAPSDDSSTDPFLRKVLSAAFTVSGASSGSSATARSGISVPGGALPGGSITSRAAPETDQAEALTRRAIIEERTDDVITKANETLKRNQDLLDARSKALGMNAAAMDKLIHAQELWNSLELTDSDRKLLGTQRLEKLGTVIDDVASKQTAYDQQQIQMQNRVDLSNQVQGWRPVSRLGPQPILPAS